MKYLVSTPNQLAHALRSSCKSRNLSQNGASALVGLLPKTISALENHPGSATIDSFMKLLSALALELVLVPKKANDIGTWLDQSLTRSGEHGPAFPKANPRYPARRSSSRHWGPCHSGDHKITYKHIIAMTSFKVVTVVSKSCRDEFRQGELHFAGFSRFGLPGFLPQSKLAARL